MTAKSAKSTFCSGTVVAVVDVAVVDVVPALDHFSLPLAFLLGCLPESLADIHILQDTVWNSNRNITDVVVVFPDVTLRIQGNRTFGLSPSSVDEPVLVHFLPGNGSEFGVLLHPNASLVVDNALLTTNPVDRRKRRWDTDDGSLVRLVSKSVA